MKNIIIGILCLTCLSGFIKASPIVGYWTFNEGFGTTTQDSSIYGNNGELTSPTIWSTPGYDGTGSCIQLGGYSASDYVEVPHSSSLALVDNLYISAWIMPEDTGNTLTPVLSKGTNSGSYYLSVLNNKLYFGLNYQTGGDNIVVQGNLDVPYDDWSHIEASYHDGLISLFVNGEADTTAPFSSSIIDNGEPLYIGIDMPGYTEKYKGLIDEVVVAIPEPATLSILAFGAMLARRRRRK